MSDEPESAPKAPLTRAAALREAAEAAALRANLAKRKAQTRAKTTPQPKMSPPECP
jgi:hypothetical protein